MPFLSILSSGPLTARPNDAPVIKHRRGDPAGIEVPFAHTNGVAGFFIALIFSSSCFRLLRVKDSCSSELLGSMIDEISFSGSIARIARAEDPAVKGRTTRVPENVLVS